MRWKVPAPGGMPGIIGGIPCAGGIIPLIGIMLLVKNNRKDIFNAISMD